jgi:5-methylcytosine-specific restriction endonuclease McrA
MVVPPRVRPSHDSWYQLTAWRKRRARQLRDHPICKLCESQNIITPATVADHVTPHQGEWNAFLTTPLQSLCATCHSGDKRSQESKGWSNRIDAATGFPVDPRHPAFQKRF